jgi:hypothetical protein
MKSKYCYPELNHHLVLYKGKRYWAFEIDEDHPYENYEQACSIIIFDKLCGGVAASVDKLPDSTYKGYIPYSQQSIDIYGKTIQDIVYQVIKWTIWIERTEK